VSVWIAILVGLGSGLFGTLATISYERDSEFRRRMPEAADEYVALTMRLVQTIRDSHNQIELAMQGRSAGPLETESLDDRMSRVFRDIDELNLRLARIGLLFGTGQTADAAALAQAAVDTARNALYAERTAFERRAPGTTDFGKYTQEMIGAVLDAVVVFTLSARDDARMGRIARVARRARVARPWRRLYIGRSRGR
jgi:hypothetical protein